MLSLLLALAVRYNNKCLTSCNYNINTCYYDEKMCTSKSLTCEDLNDSFNCKPVHVSLGEWLIVPPETNSYPIGP